MNNPGNTQHASVPLATLQALLSRWDERHRCARMSVNPNLAVLDELDHCISELEDVLVEANLVRNQS